MKKIVIGTIVVLVAIPIVLFIVGVGIVVIIITVPIYAVYRFVKYLRRKWKNRGTKNNRVKKDYFFETSEEVPAPPV